MTEHVLFIQGGGEGAYNEDQLLADSLRQSLGPASDVRYPAMPNEDDVDYAQWRERIDQELGEMPGPVVLVGHSFGAAVLMRWLSDQRETANLAGVFLIAAPFMGEPGWRFEGSAELELPAGFAAGLPAGLPFYLYYGRDDEIVPFDHLALYAQLLPQATARAFDEGGHQFNNDLAAVARDIAALPRAS